MDNHVELDAVLKGPDDISFRLGSIFKSEISTCPRKQITIEAVETAHAKAIQHGFAEGDDDEAEEEDDVPDAAADGQDRAVVAESF